MDDGRNVRLDCEPECDIVLGGGVTDGLYKKSKNDDMKIAIKDVYINEPL